MRAALHPADVQVGPLNPALPAAQALLAALVGLMAELYPALKREQLENATGLMQPDLLLLGV